MNDLHASFGLSSKQAFVQRIRHESRSNREFHGDVYHSKHDTHTLIHFH